MDSVYKPETKTVYGYYDCWWYGNDCIPENKRKWSRLNKTLCFKWKLANWIRCYDMKTKVGILDKW